MVNKKSVPHETHSSWLALNVNSYMWGTSSGITLKGNPISGWTDHTKAFKLFQGFQAPKDGPFLLINDSLCIWIIPVISHCSTVSWSLASTQTLPLCTFRTQDTAFSDHSEKVPEKLIIPIQNSMLLIVFLTLLMLVSILSWYLWQRHRLFLLIRAVEVYSLTPVQFFFCLGKFKTGSKWLRNDLSFTSKSNLALSFLLSFY